MIERRGPAPPGSLFGRIAFGIAGGTNIKVKFSYFWTRFGLPANTVLTGGVCFSKHLKRVVWELVHW